MEIGEAEEYQADPGKLRVGIVHREQSLSGQWGEHQINPQQQLQGDHPEIGWNRQMLLAVGMHELVICSHGMAQFRDSNPINDKVIEGVGIGEEIGKI